MSLIYILKQVLRRGLVSYLYLFIFLLISVNMAINSVILNLAQAAIIFTSGGTQRKLSRKRGMEDSHSPKFNDKSTSEIDGT